MSLTIEAVVFDMDGVLLDSEPLWQQAEIEVFGEVGVELDVERCMQTMGLRVDEVVAHWYARHPWTARSTADVTARLLARVRTAILAEAEPTPSLHGLLAELSATGTRIALATSSPMVLVDAVIDRFELGTVFEVLASAEHEPYGKPHPGVYLTAAAGLGVAPTSCVAIEDSVNGVISAKAARMRCIAMPAPEQRGDARFAIADRVVDGLGAIGSVLADWRA